MSTISIIGTGGMATALGSRAVKAGHRIEVMNRDLAKAQALADQLGAGAKAGKFGAVPAGEIVLLAVPYSAVLEVVQHYGQALAGKILVDITNPVAPDRLSFVVPLESSGAQEIAKVAPSDAKIVKAFNTQFSHVLAADPVLGQTVDVLLAGDDARAKAEVAAFVASLGHRPMDTGPLVMARTLEHICLLSLGLMAHAIKNINFSIGVRLLKPNTTHEEQ